jgi:hypothetical protein
MYATRDAHWELIWWFVLLALVGALTFVLATPVY